MRTSVVRGLVLLLLSFMPVCAMAQDTSAQQDRKARLEKEISQLQKLLVENSSRSSNALGRLTLVRSQVAARKALVEESDRQIRLLDDSIATARKEAARLTARLDTMTVYYERLIRGAYKNRDPHLWYVYILSSKNLAQASKRYAYLRNISSQMNRQASDIKDLRLKIDEELTRLDSLKVKADKVRSERRRELEDLRSEELRCDNLVATLKKDKTRYQRELDDKRRQVEALNKEIERIIAQYMEESRKSKDGKPAAGSKPVDYGLAAEFESNKGRLPWPADGPVVEKFGRHNHPVYTSIVMPFNNGIGIGLPAGSEVASVFGGEVKSIIVMPGYNKCVLVQHGNYFSFYCKLSKVNVKAGDKVRTGQAIGTVDTIDGQTQLHFQVWKEKTPQNPEAWLRKR